MRHRERERDIQKAIDAQTDGLTGRDRDRERERVIKRGTNRKRQTGRQRETKRERQRKRKRESLG